MPILGMQSLIPIGIQFRSKHVNLENSMEALLEYVLLFIINSFLFFFGFFGSSPIYNGKNKFLG